MVCERSMLIFAKSLKLPVKMVCCNCYGKIYVAPTMRETVSKRAVYLTLKMDS